MFNMLPSLRQEGFIGSQVRTVNGQFQYTHGLDECATHYLTVIKYLKNQEKCPATYEKIIPSLERIIDGGRDTDDIIAVSRITDYNSLHKIIHYFFPQEFYEIQGTISSITSDELSQYIEDVKEECTPHDAGEKEDVITSYLEYCLTEKQAYENHERFVPTTEERMASRADMMAINRANDAARAYAYRKASEVRGNI